MKMWTTPFHRPEYLVKIPPAKDFGETVCVVETANPSHRFNLVGISGGKGVSVSFSPDEERLEVDDCAVVHECEPAEAGPAGSELVSYRGAKMDCGL